MRSIPGQAARQLVRKLDAWALDLDGEKGSRRHIVATVIIETTTISIDAVRDGLDAIFDNDRGRSLNIPTQFAQHRIEKIDPRLRLQRDLSALAL